MVQSKVELNFSHTAVPPRVPEQEKRPVTRVAAIQMVPRPTSSSNLDGASRLLQAARAQGACIAALPEISHQGVAEADKFAIAQRTTATGRIQNGSRAGQRPRPRIVAARSAARAGRSRLARPCLVKTRPGDAWRANDKIHLYDVEIPGKDERSRIPRRFGLGRRGLR